MKNVFVRFLTVLIVTLLAHTCTAEIKLQTLNGLHYSFSDSGIIITKYTGIEKNVIIPDRIQGISVVGIGDAAFADTQISSVYIPNSVKKMGAAAFSGSTVETIELSASLTELPYKCFHEATELKNITIPEGIVALGEQCFYFCINLTDIVLPEGLRYLGDCCFEQCENLQNISIPSTVCNIGDACFIRCRNIQDIYIHAVNLEMDESFDAFMFYDCPNLVVHIYENSTIETFLQEQGIPYQYI